MRELGRPDVDENVKGRPLESWGAIDEAPEEARRRCCLIFRLSDLPGSIETCVSCRRVLFGLDESAYWYNRVVMDF